MRPTPRAGVPVLLAVLLLSGCGGSPAAPAPTPASSELALRLQTPHFRLFTDKAPEEVLRAVGDRLEAELPRLQSDLGVASIRTVEVRVWHDEAAWYAEAQRYFGRRIEASGYVTGPDGIRVLAVSQVARNASHELAHCVSLYVNPRIANNPRWLWESVAIYENGERVDPRTLSYLSAGQPPTLAALNADVTSSRQIYELGYLIGEFVVARGGLPALVALIRTNGDTQAVLGLSEAAFEQAWYAFVRERYGL
jgi:hypothetical protein